MNADERKKYSLLSAFICGFPLFFVSFVPFVVHPRKFRNGRTSRNAIPARIAYLVA
jgi:hypothetical protein